MGIFELFLLAVGLSMDAFAVSVCKGLSAGRVTLPHALTAGLWFGGFQGLMPFLGWLLGSRFQVLIASIDHWIAFLLLGLIGLNMIRESRSQEEESLGTSFSPRAMLPLAVATSIDALTVGITFAFLQVDILLAVSLIGLTTFLLSAVGVKAGAVVGSRGKSWAELAGGLVLGSCWNIWASFHKRTKILRGARLCPSYFGISSQLCSNPVSETMLSSSSITSTTSAPAGGVPAGLVLVRR